MGIFHRYNSTIHGNYRRAYLRSGLITGALLAVYVLLRLLMGSPLESPTSYVSDAVMLVAMFLFMAFYRNSLPDKKITLKEAMLFGIGMAVVASLLYGIALWAIGQAAPQQTELFTTTATQQTNNTASLPASHPYWAAWWAIYAAVLMALLGGFGAFVAAIFLRNEKSEIKTRKQTSNKTNKQ